MAVKKSRNIFGDETMSMTLAISTALMTTLFVVIGGVTSLPESDDTQAHSNVETHLEQTATTETPAPEHKDDTQLAESTDSHLTTQAVTPEKPATPVVTPTPVEPTPIAPRPGANRYAENMRLLLPALEFEARFPEGSSDEPAYRFIMEKISAYRDRLRHDSAEAKKDFESRDIAFHPWSVDIIFREIQRSGNIVSAMGREYSYTGGAHPNLNWQGLIAEADTGESITLYDMFMPRVGLSPALAIAACEKIKDAKLERMGEATIDGDPIECGSSAMKDRIFNAETSLTASTTKDKFGGVMLMFAPYELGPYVEGPYTIVVSQAIFADDLRPEYRTLFSGDAIRPQTE
ncbi:DUF3298 and DUF4163 domain-containing protein [Hirschia litorea]|uniref:PdaC/SigV domain-containing protein n=1 Tax=Hirschia litorea TaxID=1199156 RepID=A0ABW2IIY1_9PROT